MLLLLLSNVTSAQTLALRRYTTANGLPQTMVYAICQDGRGQLWAGTQGGVCVFNGQEFRTYDGRHHLPDNHVRAVAPAPDGTIWLGHEYGGVSWLREGRVHPCRLRGLHLPAHVRSIYCASSQIIWVATAGQGLWRLQCGPRDTLLTRFGRGQGLPSDSVSCVKPGPGGQLWAATAGGLVAVGLKTQALPASPNRTAVNGFHCVGDTLAWCATANGLLRLNCRAKGQPWQIQRYDVSDGLCSNQVLNVVQDRTGQVWVATGGGLCRAQRGQRRFVCFAGQRNFDSEQAHDLLEDREGSLWIVDDNGLGQHLADERFTQYAPAEGLPDNEVHSVLKIGLTTYWVGTRAGLVALNTAAASGRPFRPVPLPGGLGGHFVRSLLRDRRGGIWVGTQGEGALRYDPGTQRWTSFNQKPGVRGQRIASMAEDRRGRVWLATRQGGVTVFDPASGSFRNFNDENSALGSSSFWKVFRDHAGRLWLGSDEAGLILVDTEHDTFRRVDGREGRLSVGSISEDQQGNLWLGSIGAGLLRYEPGTGYLQAFGLETGLQTLNPYFAQCDSAGHVWLGTNRGLDCFTIATRRAVSYGPAEGFAGLETNQNAVIPDQAGQLWIGTVNGLMHYDPARAHANRVAPQTQLTGLRVAFRDTTLTTALVLPYRLNNLAFEYVGVSLTNPAKVRYQYRLRGFDETWRGPVTTTAATYTNLPSGSYTFEVKAANNEGIWNREPVAFSFQVRPPWWRAWWAYVLYASSLGLGMYVVLANTKARERQRAERQLERQALLHLQELDRVKTDFFTNVSHELRTPLTLILGPAEMLATEPADAVVREQGGMVLRNAQRLLTLINRLLDLSKLEAGALRLLPTSGDVARTVRQLVAAFEPLAASRGINLHFEAAAELPLVFDEAKLEDILTNLLANALRFTPNGGEVRVLATSTVATVAAPLGGVSIMVQDSGVGIAAADLPHLFDRFYQATAPVAGPLRTGTGIGLALVRELTELHGGTVAASSTPGAGAHFTVWLPVGLRPVAEIPMPMVGPVSVVEGAVAELLADAEYGPAEAAGVNAEADLVLVIEDSAEIREFIRATLAAVGYRLLLAADGTAGIGLAQAEVPDLVVSDVMMPGLDGYQVCAQLKADPATSHIPVVLLTAKSGPDARLEGLETGADSFLAKPFAPRELRAQVRNLLTLRQQVRARVETALQPALPVEEPLTAAEPAPAVPDPLAAHVAAVAALPSADQKFLNRLNELILQHLDDEEFGVDQLGQEIGLSRTQLHRKLKAITGQSPGDCIRQTRLLRALALLQARVGTVAEVAYQVGFSSPNHFSTAFSKQFGYPPSAVGKGDAV
ncbi:two-component regulator propeller domain-containing protein [Hymenobacter sp. ASUV-10]|uniref:histidine kinase n=1 Tax=Hymenobacter aranciens TaxID=3063996 RepID=A0ABT9BHM7_9BACT|nr:two-component regulator propeller domain-containing protein [Hymenobacter sp. ASUV-10]MDO7877209.1 two-component regulator propeller domain-containing protein [Hymenobacter sp. ASUV-10]